MQDERDMILHPPPGFREPWRVREKELRNINQQIAEVLRRGRTP